MINQRFQGNLGPVQSTMCSGNPNALPNATAADIAFAKQQQVAYATASSLISNFTLVVNGQDRTNLAQTKLLAALNGTLITQASAAAYGIDYQNYFVNCVDFVAGLAAVQAMIAVNNF
jgi:hypothetical protein